VKVLNGLRLLRSLAGGPRRCANAWPEPWIASHGNLISMSRSGPKLLAHAQQTRMNQADPIKELLGRLLADQRKRWTGGERVLVEAYCRKYCELASFPEGLLDLIYNEVFLRECRG